MLVNILNSLFSNLINALYFDLLHSIGILTFFELFGVSTTFPKNVFLFNKLSTSDTMFIALQKSKYPMKVTTSKGNINAISSNIFSLELLITPKTLFSKLCLLRQLVRFCHVN